MKQDENGEYCELGFIDQCKIVWEGAKRGVKYDGCTGVPDFSFGSDCCGEHDAHYQLSDIPRSEADRRLRECILKKGYPFIAWSYWIGVRTLGWFFYRKKQNETFPLATPDDRA